MQLHGMIVNDVRGGKRQGKGHLAICGSSHRSLAASRGTCVFFVPDTFRCNIVGSQ